jgi:hypothetical protein
MTTSFDGQQVKVTTIANTDYVGISRGVTDGALELETHYGSLHIPCSAILAMRKPEYRIPVRDILIEESYPYSHMVVRTVLEGGERDGHVLYVGSTRRGEYKTDRGLLAAIARYADEVPRSFAEPLGVRNDEWSLADIHARLAARFAAGETPLGTRPRVGS